MQISAAVDWIKSNPIYSLIGVVVTVMGFISGVPRTWQATSEVLGIPECGHYSEVYYFSAGQFRHNDQKWIDLQSDGKKIFAEISRDPKYITLKNQTPRIGHTQDNMLVRLPVCGGTVQWTTENPLHWTDLYDAYRPEKASAEQRKFQENLVERSML
jgi:hypothetical protein